jgi:hypothetical protein
MTWLAAFTWAKENWKPISVAVIALLVFLIVKLWGSLNTAQGQLTQCQTEKTAAEKKVEVSAATLAELQADVKSNYRGSFEFEVDPGAPVAKGDCPPCPKITLKGDCTGATDAKAGGAVKTTATASVTEKPGPGNVPVGSPAWALAVGGGLSLPGANIYHGSVAIDYHALRAYGTLDTQGVWTAGAQAKVLTWNWP